MAIQLHGNYAFMEPVARSEESDDGVRHGAAADSRISELEWFGGFAQNNPDAQESDHACPSSSNDDGCRVESVRLPVFGQCCGSYSMPVAPAYPTYYAPPAGCCVPAPYVAYYAPPVAYTTYYVPAAYTTYYASPYATYYAPPVAAYPAYYAVARLERVRRARVYVAGQPVRNVLRGRHPVSAAADAQGAIATEGPLAQQPRDEFGVVLAVDRAFCALDAWGIAAGGLRGRWGAASRAVAIYK